MKKTLRRAFAQTLPVLCGYLFLGIAFGLLLQRAGYGWVWALCISLFVYSGALQFVLVGFLSGGASLLSVAVMSLSLGSRHMFYGLSFLEKFRAMGKKGLYMVFSLTDETYSLLCATRMDNQEDKRLYFCMALLDQVYWIAGSVLGAVAGGLLPLDLAGIDFAMTALFVVIFVEQWKSFSSHLPAVVGAVCGVASLAVFGSDGFVLPALALSVLLLTVCRGRVLRAEREGEGQ